jgi:hypothetical protein
MTTRTADQSVAHGHVLCAVLDGDRVIAVDCRGSAYLRIRIGGE